MYNIIIIIINAELSPNRHWQGPRSQEVGEEGDYTYRYTVTTRMTPAFKMCSDESRFNVSLIVRDKVTTQYPQSTIFEEKGEPKRIRT